MLIPAKASAERRHRRVVFEVSDFIVQVAELFLHDGLDSEETKLRAIEYRDGFTHQLVVV
jgi:hypothetical protein